MSAEQVAYITGMTSNLMAVGQAANDNTSFPGGKWPVAINPGAKGTMDDGSVTDKDNDWSVPKR